MQTPSREGEAEDGGKRKEILEDVVIRLKRGGKDAEKGEDDGEEKEKSCWEEARAAKNQEVERGQEEKIKEGHGATTGDFEGGGKEHARMEMLEKAGVGGKFPDKEMGPVHGAAVGGVVHVGVADAPVAGEEHVAGVG